MQIPGFQIVREIGKGGMATVYLAVQESLDRDVAIKVMSPFLAEDATFGDRFVREAKIVAKLTHPYIIAVYDAGTVDGQFYIAMQYSPGGDLKQKIASGLTEQQAVIITQQIASALQYAHEKGFIHRDVKPANILFDQHGNACLTDFGVAKATSAATTNLTVAGSVIGTPTYMSPEQARGDNISHCSDLYSLGVVFYEMLSGQPPYHGDSGVSIAIKHISDPVPQLPAGFVRYQDFVNKLLSKNPQQRFQSGNEIIQELNNIYQYSNDSFTQIMPQSPPLAQPTGPHSGLGQVPLSQPMAAQRGATLPPTQSVSQQISQPVSQALSQPMAAQQPPPAYQTSANPPPSRKLQWSVALSLLLIGGLVAAYLIFEPDIKIGIQSASKTPDEVKPTPIQAETKPQQTITSSIELDDQANKTNVFAPQAGNQAAADRKQTKIAELLRVADQAFNNNNFVFPENQSALSGYQKVLDMDPDNRSARNGIRRIGEHYLKYATEAAQKNNLFLAEQHLTQAQALIPDDPQISELRTKIEHARQQQRNEQSAEQQRLALAQQRSGPGKTDKVVGEKSPSGFVEKIPATATKTNSANAPKPQSVTQVKKGPQKTASPPPQQSAKQPAKQPAPKKTSPPATASPQQATHHEESVSHSKLPETKQHSQVVETPAQAADSQVAILEKPHDSVSDAAAESERLRQIEKQIKELNQKGRTLLAKRDLSYEEIDQAHNYYKEIDALSPNHKLAKRGYSLVIRACIRLATHQYRRRDYNDARRTVYKGLSIDRQNSRLRSLDRRLKNAPAGNRS